ncbi:MAG: CARDB domain-containing protein [Candidatus Natronoplasma sp.]
MKVRRLLSFLIISILVLSVWAAFVGASQDERLDRGIRIEIEDEERMEEVFLNITEEFRVNIGGFFEFEGQRINVDDADNWTLDVETAADASVQPEEQSSNESSEFSVQVMMSEKGKAKLNFTASCTKENETRYSERQFELRVVEPKTVSFKVDNPTSYELDEVKLRLYIDDELKNTRVVKNIGPEETRQVKFNWSSHGLEAGEHDLEVRADYGLNEEKVLLTHPVYIEGETNTALYAGIGALAVGASVVVFLLYRRKKRRRRRPW